MFIRNDAPDTPENLRWRNLETLALVLFVGTALYQVMSDAFALSEGLAETHAIKGLQSSVWSSSRQVDLNDGQLRSFRENLPLLIIAAFLFVWLKTPWSRLYPGKEYQGKLHFYLVSGLGACLYLHGPGVLFLLLWAIVNYKAGETFKGMRFYPIVVWVGNLAFLLLAEYCHGFKFQWIGLSSLVLVTQDTFEPQMRWEQSSNLCFLKLISYLLDAHWSAAKKCTECTSTINCLRYRQETHADDYSLIGLLAYFFYLPLYFAGPTITYNAWISQIRKPQQVYDSKRKAIYVLRLIGAAVILELAIHFLYLPTIANNPENRALWDSFNPYELAISTYLVLKWIWLKFLVIWRFFRIWALYDGIESPENMGRCMSDNYCFEGFWRMWHRAFNQWLIRYLFIPLGGSKYKIYNIWVVFLFVAVWHDLSLHLLVWGWGMCFFIVPEVLVKAFINQHKFDEFRKTVAYNWLQALAVGAYIILMMLANLIGFSIGLEGLGKIWKEIVEGEGLKFVVKAWFLVTVCSQILFDYRRREEKSGYSYKGY